VTPPVDVRTVEAEPFAGIAGHVTRATLPSEIYRLLDRVWPFVRRDDLHLTTNHNVVVYHGDPDAPDGADVVIGVQVDRRFDDDHEAGVQCHELPSGRAAHAVHVGPYDRMQPTYDAIVAHIAEHGLQVIGPVWEVYGDWDDDPTKLETDIYFLLAAEA
jgi:effector-binding domain-containing protein